MLLNEIIDLLTHDDGNLTEALLKTKVLLHQIGKKELAEWVNNELNGYADGSNVPAYRVIPAHVLANIASMFSSAKGHPIPLAHLTKYQRKQLESERVTQSLAVVEELASTDKDHLMRPIPMELNTHLAEGLADGFHVQRAWSEISPHDMKGVLVQVRSRLLDFLLELRDNVGDAVSGNELKEKAASFDAVNLFNHAIFGPNATIILDNRSLQVVNNVIAGDFDSLSQALTKLGIPSDEIDSLRVAVEEDEASGGKASLDGKTGAWYTRLLARATKGALDVGVDVVTTAGAKVIAAYLGVPV